MISKETGKENDQERIFIQKLLSAKDVAEILGISVKTVISWCVKESLDAFRSRRKREDLLKNRYANISNPEAPSFKLTDRYLTA